MAISNTTIAAVRFGYGRHPDQSQPSDPAGLLSQLDGPANAAADILGPSRIARARMYMTYVNIRRARKKDLSLTPELKAAAKRIRRQFRRDALARIAAPVVSPHGFQERLAWFWADHFTVNGKNNRGKLLAAPFEAEAIRPHIATSFPEMLRAAETHPGMLSFLDQFKSMGPGSAVGRKRGKGLNENLAREILELHTMGVDAGYTQRDVREFAELLTGLSIRRETAETRFRARAAEPGAETVLGRAYGGDPARIDDIHQALEDIALRPETARHIARKLATHFVADDPDPGLVAHVADAYTRNRGALTPVYEALLEHPASWAPPGAKVRQPFDYVVASLRAAGLKRRDLIRLLRKNAAARDAFIDMNQPIYQPPGPDGWPEEAKAWITPQGLAARLGWAAEFGRMMERQLDPRDYLAVALGDRASAETTFAATRAAERWEGLALIVASPEFNRR